jgi:hypothetical protein
MCAKGQRRQKSSAVKPKLKKEVVTTSGPRKITALPDFAARRKRVFKGTLSEKATRKLDRAIVGELGDEELGPLANPMIYASARTKKAHRSRGRLGDQQGAPSSQRPTGRK